MHPGALRRWRRVYGLLSVLFVRVSWLKCSPPPPLWSKVAKRPSKVRQRKRREGRESEKTRAALMKVCVLGIVVEIGRGEGEGGV